MYKSFLIKYAEIAIKGKNRYLFEDALVQNIRYHLKRVEGTFHVRKENGRIYVDTEGEYDYDETVETLQRIFGIVGICPVVLVEDEGFDALAKVVCDYVDRTYPDKNFTFKVDARRARKNYPMTSMEINAAVGEKILEAFPETSVDVHHPEVMIHIEIRPMINIYSTEIPGPGGMPLGTAGRAMLLLSGGIDSPVAGYMVSKRGVTLEATYFHAPPYTSERQVIQLIQLALFGQRAELFQNFAGVVHIPLFLALHHDIAAAQSHAHPHQFFQQADVFVPRAEHILQSPGSRGQFLFLCQRSSPPTPRRANLRRAARRWALRKRAPQSHTRTHHLSYYNLPICQGFRPRSGSLIWQFFPPRPAPDCARR